MKKVLYVISEHFAPISMISANRFTKIVKYLSREDKYDIFVFTRLEKDTEDAVLRNEAKELESNGVRVIKVDTGRYYYDKSGVQWMLHWKWIKTLDKIVGSDRRTFYEQKRVINKFVKHAIDTITINNIPKPDVIISTYGEMGGHKLAIKIKESIAPKAYWIADYRDPIYYGIDDPKLRKFFDEYSDEVEEKADKLVMISDNLATSMGINPNRSIEVITNGYDIEEYENALADDVLRFSFSGSYYVADMKILFRAVHELIQDGLIQKDKIEINYSGTYGDKYASHMKEFEIDECLNFWGNLSRRQSIQIQNMSDVVLLLSRCKFDYEVIPGKMSGSFGCKKPIICITGGDKTDSEIKRRITELHYGYCFEEPSYENEIGLLKDIILKFYHEKQEKHFIEWNVNEEKLKEYQYKTLASRYDKIIAEGIG